MTIPVRVIPEEIFAKQTNYRRKCIIDLSVFIIIISMIMNCFI